MTQLSDQPPASLAATLRSATSAAHRGLENVTRLPESIRTLDDYAACLSHFHSVVAPLEAQCAAFTALASFGLSARAPLLRADLVALGLSPAAPLTLPAVPCLPAALGALYVLEGSALGGKVILRALIERFGPRLSGATAFFGNDGPLWPAFKAKLDAFGQAEPAVWPDVIDGAVKAFGHFARAFEKEATFL